MHADAKSRLGVAYARSSQDNHILGLLKQANGIVNGIILWKLGPPGELSGDPHRQERVIGLIWRPFQDHRRYDPKSRA